MRLLRVIFAVTLVALVLARSSAAAEEKFKPFKMKTLDGVQKTLPDFLGKVTLVSFFFPTCPYCNAAFPEMQKIYDAYKSRGLSMLWINVIPDEEKLIAEWRTKHGYTIPVVLGGRGVANDYKLVMTPTHFLLDAQGGVLSKHAGYKAGDEQGLETEIQQALGAAR